MPSEAYAPTALDYPTASIGLARPSVIRNFAQPDELAVVGYEAAPRRVSSWDKPGDSLPTPEACLRYPASRAMPDESLIDKARTLHQRTHPQVRRVVVAVVGFLLLSVGAALLVLPGPGLLVIAAGIAVLALEFPWAERLAKRIQLAVETSLRRLNLKK